MHHPERYGWAVFPRLKRLLNQAVDDFTRQPLACAKRGDRAGIIPPAESNSGKQWQKDEWGGERRDQAKTAVIYRPKPTPFLRVIP